MKTLKGLELGSAMAVLTVSLVSGVAADRDKDEKTLDQTRQGDRTFQRDTATDPGRRSVMRDTLEAKNLAKGRDIVGMNIRNTQNDKTGEVKDLVVDLPEGRVRYAVVSSSEVFGNKLAAVPLGAFTRSADEKHLILNTDRERLKSAPTFESGNWPDMADRTWGKEVYGYYGVAPYWDQPGYSSQSQTTRRNEPPGTSRDLKAMSKFHRASELFGMNVENPQKEKLGDIQDLLVDLHSGRIVYAALASGGFLGLGGKYLAIPPSAFQPSADEKNLVLNVDKDRLKAAPGFDKSNWPSMADQTWTRGVYSYYGQNPYWEGDRNVAGTSRNRDYNRNDADNTSRNARDRNGDTLTPGDQGSSDSDRTLTRQIRREITRDNNLSTYAKNIKIMTVNGTVTLRGVVHSQEEKDQIEAKAKQVAGVTQVNNQLEVKQQ